MENKKILVIDDDATVLQMLQRLLAKAHGYEVAVAQDGLSGYRLACQDKPDLILLDVMLPDKSGGCIARMLSENSATQNIPIVFISVLLDAGGKKRIRINEQEYRAVSKPIYLPDLLSQIRKALNEV